jgi:trigger factor
VVDLGDYRSLRMEPEPVVVTDEQIDAQLREYQEQQAQWVPVDRPATERDQAVVDVQASLDEETIWEEENLELLLGDEDASLVPGLYEHLVGMAAGETKSFSLALPEDWDDEDYAGAEAAFEATLREVREKDVPPPDDDLAMTVGDYDSLDELRTSIREALEEEAQERIEAEFPGLVVDALVEQAEHLEYPDRAVEDQLDDMLEGLQANLQGTGLGLEQYLQLMRTTEAQYRQQLRPEAEKRLRRTLALVELARQEGLRVPPDEVEAETGRVEESLPEEATAEREWLRSPEGQRGVANRLLTERVQERLLAIARGEAPALPVEEPDAEAVADADAEPEPEAEPSAEPSDEQVPETEPADRPRAEPVAEPDLEEMAAEASGTEPEPAAEADG